MIVVLLAFVVSGTLLASQWRLAVSEFWVVPALAAYLAGVGLFGRASTAAFIRGCGGRCIQTPPRLWRRFEVRSLLIQAWLVLGLAAIILLGYGRWVERDLGLARVPLVGELLVLAPFLAALLLDWTLRYPVHVLMRRQLALARPDEQIGVWTLGQYLAFNARHSLLFIAVPVCLIVMMRDVLELYVAPRLGQPWQDWTLLAGTLGWAILVIVLSPAMIIRIWKTQRLPQGPLREELEAMCRRLAVRCRDIRIWHSGGVIANAGAMGFVAPLRYILLTDALLARMDRRQIEAIFAHEAGHVMCRHVLYSTLFAVSTSVLCMALVEAVALLTPMPDWAAQVEFLAMLGAAWLFGFGWLSRRFERQSDVVGAWAVGGAEAAQDCDGDAISPEGAALFCSALQAIADLNGLSLHQWNWRHGSIAYRVEYIMYLGSHRGSRRDIDRLVRRLKIGLWAMTIAAAALVAWQVVPL